MSAPDASAACDVDTALGALGIVLSPWSELRKENERLGEENVALRQEVEELSRRLAVLAIPL